jgi:hypothetical protein
MTMTLLGFGAATSDAELRESLPFPAPDIDRSALPSLLRRRTSQATQLAFCAADRACQQARRSPAELPAVFACAGGEIQTTDALCLELAAPRGFVSPTAFHNSVHNTAAGYWSIVHRSTRAATALAAGHETFAMALLEAWCWLAAEGGAMLLVCYDERWPGYLAPPLGAPPFAAALVLAKGRVAGGIAELGRPRRGEAAGLADALAATLANMPATAAIPLLAAAAAGDTGEIPVSPPSGGWVVEVGPPGPDRL